MSDCSILRLDGSELVSALNQLSAELAPLPLEIGIRLINGTDLSADLASINLDAGTAAAGDLTVRLQPSDRLRGLITAAIAANRDRLVIEDTGHDVVAPACLGLEP